MMKLINFGKAFLGTTLTILSVNSLASPAFAHQPCHTIDARQGWQYITFPSSGVVTEIISISGGWSVDERNYSKVGAEGHSGSDAERLAPYNQYKYDQGYPFGTLLVDIPTNGHGYIGVTDPVRLPLPISRTAIRINDKDESLGDNGGSLTVCFQHVHH